MPRFSKLKKRIESLFSPDANLKVRCTCYGYIGWGGYRELPRLWITLNKEIIFDFLKDFKDLRIPDPNAWSQEHREIGYPVLHYDIMFVNDLIQEYIETPVDILFDHDFIYDHYGLTDILKAADRRIGKNRLLVLKDKTQSEAAKKIIEVRLGIPPIIVDEESLKAGKNDDE